MRGDLQRGEAAVRDAHHVDVAVAPRLRREPLDGVDAVGLLLEHVLVGVDALGRAGAADVDARDDVAVPRRGTGSEASTPGSTSSLRYGM